MDSYLITINIQHTYMHANVLNITMQVEPQGNNKYKFKSQKTGKYLRFKDANTIDVKGTGGDHTPFYKYNKGSNWVELKNVKYGKYLCVKSNQKNELTIESSASNKNRCRWKAWR